MKLTIILPRVKNSFFSLSLILSAVNILCTSDMLWQITYLSPTFQLISIIPAVYTLVFIVCRRFADFTSPGCFTIHLIGFLRYMLTPFIIVTSKQLSAMEHAFDDIGSAVLIMIIEMIFIFGATLLYNPHDIVHPADKIRFPSIIKFLAIMAFLFFAIDNRSLIGNLSVFSGKVTVEDTNATSGIVSIIWQALCAFIFCFIINDIASNRRHKRLLLLSLVCGLIYLLVIFTGQTELSRWYTIVTLIAMTFWMFKLYPNRKRSILLAVLIPTFVLIFVASILKNTDVGLGAGWGKALNSMFNSTNMDSYFAGPANVSNAIATNRIYSPGLGSLFFDIFNNFPVINHIFDHTHASVNYFARYLSRGDQILPLVGQSFTWFSYALTPLLSVLSVIMTKKLDAKFRGTDGIFTYLYGFFAVWCALMPVLNMTIWLSWIYARIIPAFLLFRIVTLKSSYPVRLGGRNEYQSKQH